MADTKYTPRLKDEYNSRIKGALLGWHALMHAIADNDGQAVSTEEEGQP